MARWEATLDGNAWGSLVLSQSLTHDFNPPLHPSLFTLHSQVTMTIIWTGEAHHLFNTCHHGSSLAICWNKSYKSLWSTCVTSCLFGKLRVQGFFWCSTCVVKVGQAPSSLCVAPSLFYCSSDWSYLWPHFLWQLSFLWLPLCVIYSHTLIPVGFYHSVFPSSPGLQPASMLIIFLCWERKAA